MARNVYAMNVWVRDMKMPYRVLSETAPEFSYAINKDDTFGPATLARIDWEPVPGEDLTPEFMSNLVSDGIIQRVRVYRAQIDRGGRKGAFGSKGGRPVSRETIQPWE